MPSEKKRMSRLALLIVAFAWAVGFSVAGMLLFGWEPLTKTEVLLLTLMSAWSAE